MGRLKTVITAVLELCVILLVASHITEAHGHHCNRHHHGFVHPWHDHHKHHNWLQQWHHSPDILLHPRWMSSINDWFFNQHWPWCHYENTQVTNEDQNRASVPWSNGDSDDDVMDQLSMGNEASRHYLEDINEYGDQTGRRYHHEGIQEGCQGTERDQGRMDNRNQQTHPKYRLSDRDTRYRERDQRQQQYRKSHLKPSHQHEPQTTFQNHQIRRKIAALQVEGYYPTEITITSQGEKLFVTGRQTCDCTDSCLQREFERVYHLPTEVDKATLKALLDASGHLEISGIHHSMPKFSHKDVRVHVQSLGIPEQNPEEHDESCIKHKTGIKLQKINKKTGQPIIQDNHSRNFHNIRNNDPKSNDDNLRYDEHIANEYYDDDDTTDEVTVEIVE